MNKELALFAEIESSNKIVSFTAFEPGIWRILLYVTGDLLPFMEDNFRRTPVNVNNIIIDNEEYVLLGNDINELRSFNVNRGAYVNAGSVIYIRFPHFNPPYVFFSFAYGLLVGFTDGKPVLKDGIMYKTGLLTSPKINTSVDALAYDRMKFNVANVSIDNSDGQFDNAEEYFGNDFNLKYGEVENNEEELQQNFIQTIEEAGSEKVVSIARDTDEYIVLSKDKQKKDEPLKMLAQYYVENISVSLGKADFKLSDKRERFAAKIPSKQYTNNPEKDGYYCPDIDDSYLDKDVQEVYGRCFGVPGVCLEGKRIYDDSGNYLNYYRFRFASQISRIDRIQVKMTSGEIDGIKTDGWTTVYENGQWKQYIIPGNFNEMANGIISLSSEVAKQAGEIDNQANEVRMDGIFKTFDCFPNGTPRATPKRIIKYIMNEYSNVLDSQFNLGEFNEELGPLDNYEIGIMFDRSISVYEAIEKLQSGSVLGFQFQAHENKFTARLDNPNRAERQAISYLDILNLNEIEIDYNATLYGSYTNIEYALNYDESEPRKLIDKSKQKEILALHRVDKEWNAKTLLANENDAKFKSRIILEDFSKMRPIIKNIKLFGEKWFDLRIYDIMYIDFRIPGDEIEKYPRHLIRLIRDVGEEEVLSLEENTERYVVMGSDEKKPLGRRGFAGRLRCELLGVAKDTLTGVTTIETRATEVSKSWKER
jgi:hypothetical protein